MSDELRRFYMKAAEEASAPLLARIDLLELEVKAETTRRKQLELLREHDEKRIVGVDMVYEECKRLEKENEDLLKRCIELESIRTARMERLEEACRVARLAMTPKYNPKECAALDAVIPGSVRSRPSTGHTEPEPRRCGICGGVVQHDGGKPDPECWPGGNRRNG